MFPRRLALPLLAAVALPLAAPAASPAAGGPYPTIRSVSPKKVALGQTLTIKGSHFRKGKNANTVVFKRDGGKAVFVRAISATRSKLKVVVPAKLLPYFRQTGGKPQATRFRLRILAKRFGKRFTPNGLTPLVTPLAVPPSGPPPAVCDPAAISVNATGDSDRDGIPDGVEKRIGTNPCSADTDGDGVSDGFEYNSALDLNSKAVPYPGKRPYPNPLDGSDAHKDFDGDGLELIQEYEAWVYMGKPMPYTYSDGTKWSIGHVPARSRPEDGPAVDPYRDDNRDVDQDGLTNGEENDGTLAGPMQPAWWVAVYDGTNGPKETPYYGPQMPGPSMIDPDTDGDGIKDGADDQDHDGYPNWFEVRRPADWQCRYVSMMYPSDSPACDDGARNPLARVQPFNPCKPIHSFACHVAWPLGYYQKGEDWDSPVQPGDPGTEVPAGGPPKLVQ
jgi:hypothetical protein